MFGNRLLIGLSRILHAHIAYEIDTAKIIDAFFRISNCLYDLIRLNSIACRIQTTRCTTMQFSLIDSVIYWLCLGFFLFGCLNFFILIFHMKQMLPKNHHSILLNFLLFARFDTIEFIRVPSSNNKIYDDAIFADRFRYQMTMFEVGILMGLAQLLDPHITYEIFI